MVVLKRPPREYILSVLAALCISIGWRMPGTTACAVLGWIGVGALIIMLQAGGALYRASYLGGVTLHLIGFSWLRYTIAEFGGFPPPAAWGVFVLFALTGALQLPLLVFLYKQLPSGLNEAALRAPIALAAVETLMPRIFPWQLGHMQIAFLPLAQTADIAGVTLITFLVAWLTEAMILTARRRCLSRYQIAPIGIFVLAVLYGVAALNIFGINPDRPQKIALIQGNVSIEEKHNAKLIVPNVSKYRSLTEQIDTPSTLIVWPETVILDYVHAGVGSILNDNRLPRVGPNSASLIGAITYESPQRIFNSAMAILPDGTVPQPYHKRILMPFGEYVPYGDLFPWIREISGNIQDLTPGDGIRVFEYHMRDGSENGYILRAAPLICYEDAIPGPAQESTRAGAQLLVNITNDAWFGDTAAPLQHHMIASFRAIENRRFLIRATNTGLTAVVDPLGRTTAALPLFSSGSLEQTVHLLNYRSIFTNLPIELLWQILAIGVLLTALGRRLWSGLPWTG